MSVPETAVHEDGGAVFPHHDVGTAGHGFHAQAVAVAVVPQPLPHLDFGFGVAAADVRHAAVALCGGHGVGHGNQFLLRMTSAAMTPGTQPAQVRMKTISTDPHPRSSTASGGKIMAKRTRRRDMDLTI